MIRTALVGLVGVASLPRHARRTAGDAAAGSRDARSRPARQSSPASSRPPILAHRRSRMRAGRDPRHRERPDSHRVQR